VRPTPATAGSVVLGSDSEQVARVARALRAEREVRLRASSSSLLSSGRGSGDDVLRVNSQQSTKITVRRCRARRDVPACGGGVVCMHDVHETLSRDAMRAACQHRGIEHRFEREWCERMRKLMEHKPRLSVLAHGGVTVELLVYCKYSLHALLTDYGYTLEDVIDVFALTFDDLCLLGFNPTFLQDKTRYPLITLCEKAGVCAEELFAFDMSYAMFKKCVLDVDERYARLLDINLPYWHKIMGSGTATTTL